MADKPFRDRLAGDLDKRYDKLLKVIDDGMQATRKTRVSVTCRFCNRQQNQDVDVQDVKAAIAAAEFFANQGLGRPGVAEDGDATATHVYKFIYQVPSLADVPPDAQNVEVVKPCGCACTCGTRSDEKNPE